MEAASIRTEVFGAGLQPTKLNARNLLLRVEQVQHKLVSQPLLRERFEAYVPAKMIDRLFEEAAALGARWGARTEAEAKVAPAFSTVALKQLLRQRMGEFISNVLATVDMDDPSTVARATKVLEPLVELRDEVALRRVRAARTSKAEAEVEPEEEAEPEEEEEVEVDAELPVTANED